jgi:exosortase
LKLKQEVPASSGTDLKKRHAFFAAIMIASAAMTWKIWGALALYSFHDDSYSHILLIPFISFCLVYMARAAIFADTHTSIWAGVLLVAMGLAALWLAGHRFALGPYTPNLSLGTLAIILIWAGGFVLCYGIKAALTAFFPLAFLLLMMPLPDSVLAWIIRLLQEGSTDVAFFIFKACGVPVLRQGFVLTLPSVSIEVATECSSIRSSIGLLITCILAAHFFLRTTWRAWLLTAFVIPLSVLKNGIRIATLTLLSIYVDPRFLTGSLHRDGGFVFFLLALGLLWPVLLILQRSESGGIGNRVGASSLHTPTSMAAARSANRT